MKRLLTLSAILLLLPACRKYKKIKLAPLTKQTAEFQYKKNNITVYSHVLTPAEKNVLFAGRSIRSTLPVQITIKNKDSSTLYFDPQNCSLALIHPYSLMSSLQRNAFAYTCCSMGITLIPTSTAVLGLGLLTASLTPLSEFQAYVIAGSYWAINAVPSLYTHSVVKHNNIIVKENILENILEKTVIHQHQIANGLLFVNKHDILSNGLSIQLEKIGTPQWITIHITSQAKDRKKQNSIVFFSNI